MRQTVKDITSILIITIVVLSLAYGFTTRAKATDWISEDLQYVVYNESNGCMILSAAPVYYATINTSWTALKTDNDAITTPYNGSGTYFYVPAQQVDAGLYFPEAYYLDPVYSEEGNIAQYHVYAASHFIGQNGTYAVIIANTDRTPIGSSGTICANHNITGWSGTINDLPDNIGFDENSLSGVGQQAIIIQQTIETAVSDYNAGTITAEQLQTVITQQTAQLDSLSPSGIADLIAVNNAQNSIQIANTEIIGNDLKVNSSLQNDINGIIINVSRVFGQYKNGNISQSEAMQEMRNASHTLAIYQTQPANSSVADQMAIQTALNEVNNYVEIISNWQDINMDVAESAQEGEEREKEYLNDLTAETTTTIEQLSPSQNLTGEQISVTTEILQGVWENPIVKKIIPLCACFLVICVALGIKYRL